MGDKTVLQAVLLLLLTCVATNVHSAPFSADDFLQQKQTDLSTLFHSSKGGMIGPLFKHDMPHNWDSPDGGCFYQFQHYEEGDRIITNEPCLNCTCHNSMLMCYLKVCPFSKPIGQDCTIEKRPDQCCPVIICPQVPVGVQVMSMMTSTTTQEPIMSSTAMATTTEHGCTIEGRYYPDGAQVPGVPDKPCELCYCIRNHTACVMQECILKVNGCDPVFEDGICCPVRYKCAYDEIEGFPTTTEGGLIGGNGSAILPTTTMIPGPIGCMHKGEFYSDGASIPSEDPCEHCYCMKSDLVCAIQECRSPLDEMSENCTPRTPAPGQCCPEAYDCPERPEATTVILDYSTSSGPSTTESSAVEDEGTTIGEDLLSFPTSSGTSTTESPAVGDKETTIAEDLLSFPTSSGTGTTESSTVEDEETTITEDLLPFPTSSGTGTTESSTVEDAETTTAEDLLSFPTSESDDGKEGSIYTTKFDEATEIPSTEEITSKPIGTETATSRATESTEQTYKTTGVTSISGISTDDNQTETGTPTYEVSDPDMSTIAPEGTTGEQVIVQPSGSSSETGIQADGDGDLFPTDAHTSEEPQHIESTTKTPSYEVTEIAHTSSSTVDTSTAIAEGEKETDIPGESETYSEKPYDSSTVASTDDLYTDKPGDYEVDTDIPEGTQTSAETVTESLIPEKPASTDETFTEEAGTDRPIDGEMTDAPLEYVTGRPDEKTTVPDDKVTSEQDVVFPTDTTDDGAAPFDSTTALITDEIDISGTTSSTIDVTPSFKPTGPDGAVTDEQISTKEPVDGTSTDISIDPDTEGTTEETSLDKTTEYPYETEQSTKKPIDTEDTEKPLGNEEDPTTEIYTEKPTDSGDISPTTVESSDEITTLKPDDEVETTDKSVDEVTDAPTDIELPQVVTDGGESYTEQPTHGEITPVDGVASTDEPSDVTESSEEPVTDISLDLTTDDNATTDKPIKEMLPERPDEAGTPTVTDDITSAGETATDDYGAEETTGISDSDDVTSKPLTGESTDEIFTGDSEPTTVESTLDSSSEFPHITETYPSTPDDTEASTHITPEEESHTDFPEDSKIHTEIPSDSLETTISSDMEKVTESPISKDDNCLVNGNEYDNGSPVPASKCQESCVCFNGNVSCELQACPPAPPTFLRCVSSIPEGECCPSYTCPPVQPDVTESPGCIRDGVQYFEGEFVPSHDHCTDCYCLDGEIICAHLECQMPEGQNCKPTERPPGSCCPTKYYCESVMPEIEDQTKANDTEDQTTSSSILTTSSDSTSQSTESPKTMMTGPVSALETRTTAPDDANTLTTPMMATTGKYEETTLTGDLEETSETEKPQLPSFDGEGIGFPEVTSEAAVTDNIDLATTSSSTGISSDSTEISIPIETSEISSDGTDTDSGHSTVISVTEPDSDTSTAGLIPGISDEGEGTATETSDYDGEYSTTIYPNEETSISILTGEEDTATSPDKESSGVTPDYDETSTGASTIEDEDSVTTFMTDSVPEATAGDGVGSTDKPPHITSTPFYDESSSSTVTDDTTTVGETATDDYGVEETTATADSEDVTSKPSTSRPEEVTYTSENTPATSEESSKVDSEADTGYTTATPDISGTGSSIEDEGFGSTIPPDTDTDTSTSRPEEVTYTSEHTPATSEDSSKVDSEADTGYTTGTPDISGTGSSIEDEGFGSTIPPDTDTDTSTSRPEEVTYTSENTPATSEDSSKVDSEADTGYTTVTPDISGTGSSIEDEGFGSTIPPDTDTGFGTDATLPPVDPSPETLNETTTDSETSITFPESIPGEGSCMFNNTTYANGDSIPPTTPCHESCTCRNSIIECTLKSCPPAPPVFLRCEAVEDPEECCPTYECPPLTTESPESPDCLANGTTYAHGDFVPSEDLCTDCYCLDGSVLCATLECPKPKGKNCKPLNIREGSCCPESFECEDSVDTVDSTTPPIDSDDGFSSETTTESSGSIEEDGTTTTDEISTEPTKTDQFTHSGEVFTSTETATISSEISVTEYVTATEDESEAEGATPGSEDMVTDSTAKVEEASQPSVISEGTTIPSTETDEGITEYPVVDDGPEISTQQPIDLEGFTTDIPLEQPSTEISETDEESTKYPLGTTDDYSTSTPEHSPGTIEISTDKTPESDDDSALYPSEDGSTTKSPEDIVSSEYPILFPTTHGLTTGTYPSEETITTTESPDYIIQIQTSSEPSTEFIDIDHDQPTEGDETVTVRSTTLDDQGTTISSVSDITDSTVQDGDTPQYQTQPPSEVTSSPILDHTDDSLSTDVTTEYPETETQSHVEQVSTSSPEVVTTDGISTKTTQDDRSTTKYPDDDITEVYPDEETEVTTDSSSITEGSTESDDTQKFTDSTTKYPLVEEGSATSGDQELSTSRPEISDASTSPIDDVTEIHTLSTIDTDGDITTGISLEHTTLLPDEPVTQETSTDVSEHPITLSPEESSTHKTSTDTSEHLTTLSGVSDTSIYPSGDESTTGYPTDTDISSEKIPGQGESTTAYPTDTDISSEKIPSHGESTTGYPTDTDISSEKIPSHGADETTDSSSITEDSTDTDAMDTTEVFSATSIDPSFTEKPVDLGTSTVEQIAISFVTTEAPPVEEKVTQSTSDLDMGTSAPGETGLTSEPSVGGEEAFTEVPVETSSSSSKYPIGTDEFTTEYPADSSSSKYPVGTEELTTEYPADISSTSKYPVETEEFTTEHPADVSKLTTEHPTDGEEVSFTTTVASPSATDTDSGTELPSHEGCLIGGIPYENNSSVPSSHHCQENCKCSNGMVLCEKPSCPPAPPGFLRCATIPATDDCCPTYDCPPITDITDPAVTDSPTCSRDGEIYIDGDYVPSLTDCTDCYCLGGEIVCAELQCVAPGENCQPISQSDNSCCPDKYECAESSTVTPDAVTTTEVISTETSPSYSDSTPVISSATPSGIPVTGSALVTETSSTSLEGAVTITEASVATSGLDTTKDSSATVSSVLPEEFEPEKITVIPSTGDISHDPDSVSSTDTTVTVVSTTQSSLVTVVPAGAVGNETQHSSTVKPSLIESTSDLPTETEEPKTDSTASGYATEATVAITEKESTSDNVFVTESGAATGITSSSTVKYPEVTSDGFNEVTGEGKITMTTSADSLITQTSGLNLTDTSSTGVTTSHGEYSSTSPAYVSSSTDLPISTSSAGTDSPTSSSDVASTTPAPFPPYPGLTHPDYPSPSSSTWSPETTTEFVLGPGACLFDGKVYVSAQQIPRDDPCDFCFCFRGDIICLQQSCPPPIPGCYEEPIVGFCCPRYECPVTQAVVNVTTTTTPIPYYPSIKRTQKVTMCEIGERFYHAGELVEEASGPCLECRCGHDGMLECDPKQCDANPMLRKILDSHYKR